MEHALEPQALRRGVSRLRASGDRVSLVTARGAPLVDTALKGCVGSAPRSGVRPGRKCRSPTGERFVRRAVRPSQELLGAERV